MARPRAIGQGPDEGMGEGDSGGGGVLRQFDPNKIAEAVDRESPGFEPPDLGGDQGEADVHRKFPTPFDPISAKSGETGRERGMLQGGNATLRRPSSPSPMAGSVSPAQGPLPFQPMGSPDQGMMASPQGSLFGSAGGLQGGGLGMSLDPVSNQQSSSIEDLLQMLLGKQGL